MLEGRCTLAPLPRLEQHCSPEFWTRRLLGKFEKSVLVELSQQKYRQLCESSQERTATNQLLDAACPALSRPFTSHCDFLAPLYKVLPTNYRRQSQMSTKCNQLQCNYMCKTSFYSSIWLWPKHPIKHGVLYLFRPTKLGPIFGI